MAEGLMNSLYGDDYEAYSAGTKPTGVNPYAITAMAEIGIDISQHKSKHIEEFRDRSFDYVVTVCDNARETCPFFPGARELIHKGFKDPAMPNGSSTVALATFRNTRNEIQEFLKEKFGKEK
jgi:arsenate reductase